MNPAYAYRGLLAESWDLFAADRTGPDDRDFFLEVVRRFGDPVLDAGCGTGRLLLDFIGEGHDVDGLDVSPEMLEICEDKADQLGVTIDVYLQPIEELDLAREYRTIIVPAPVFQMITDPAVARTGLRRFREHLAPEGAVAVALQRLDTVRRGHDDAGVPGEWSEVTERPRPAGDVVRRSSRTRPTETGDLIITEDLYEVLVDGEVVASETHEMPLRGYTVEAATEMFRGGGYGEPTVCDGHTFEPLRRPDPELFVVIATAG